MATTSQKKADKTSTTAPDTTPAPALKIPDLIAYHTVPTPAGTSPTLVPIGGAIAHEDGEGFTLHLHLLPTTGGRIILRAPKPKKTP